jgi:hypothetical protein
MRMFRTYVRMCDGSARRGFLWLRRKGSRVLCSRLASMWTQQTRRSLCERRRVRNASGKDLEPNDADNDAASG